jgi:hypothetical protein
MKMSTANMANKSRFMGLKRPAGAVASAAKVLLKDTAGVPFL